MSEVTVSVIVACYQPVWEKLRATLKSILLQEGVDFEIIVADDGSKENYFERVRRLFQEFRFEQYTLLEKEGNEGTVKNLWSGVKAAGGEFTKMISPGDCFYEKNSLLKMVSFMKEHDLKVSFSDCVFYNTEEGKIMLRQVQNSPRKPYLFDLDQYDREAVIYEYFLMGYNIIGASFFNRTGVLKEYLEKIVGKVIYLEDYMYKLMVADGISLIHQQETTVWYEYATGITVSKDPEKQKRMQNDADRAYEEVKRILSGRNWFEKRVGLYLKNIERPGGRKVIKAFCFPLRSLKELSGRDRLVMTPTDGIRTDFLEECAFRADAPGEPL